jgi:hypothetical protein
VLNGPDLRLQCANAHRTSTRSRRPLSREETV